MRMLSNRCCSGKGLLIYRSSPPDPYCCRMLLRPFVCGMDQPAPLPIGVTQHVPGIATRYRNIPGHDVGGGGVREVCYMLERVLRSDSSTATFGAPRANRPIDPLLG